MGKRKSRSSEISKDSTNQKKRRIENNKRQKKSSVEKFWIESCVEKRPNNPQVLKNAVHLWITRVELYDDHPSAISNNKVSPICDPTAVVQEDEEKLVSPASSNKVAPIIIRASASPVATLATASIASENEDDLQSTSTTSASFQGKEGGDDEGGRIKRPEPFICVHIHPSAKKKLKVNSMYT
jgi:hypothetical protein